MLKGDEALLKILSYAIKVLLLSDSLKQPWKIGESKKRRNVSIHSFTSCDLIIKNPTLLSLLKIGLQSL